MTRALRASFLAFAIACSSSTNNDAPAINGCTSATYVDGASGVTVDFGGSNASPLFGYAPACLHVTPGTSVTFSGDFSVHPLSPGTDPNAIDAGSPNTPIPQTNSGTSLSVTFPTAGTYPYFCQMHYAAGMTGVVWVQ